MFSHFSLLPYPDEEPTKYIPEEKVRLDKEEVYGDTDEAPEEDPRGEGKRTSSL